MTIATNLARLRKEKSLSQPELAKKSGVSQQLISQIERGVNTSTKHLPRLAAALEVAVVDLDPSYGVNDEEERALRVPLLSWVSAGNLVVSDTPVDLHSAQTVAGPALDGNGEWIALRVEGDSMNRISPPDSVIFVNLKDKRLVPNACYVIATEDGAASYKRYRPSAPNWHPVSTNPKHKPITSKEANGLKVIGRVRKSILDM